VRVDQQAHARERARQLFVLVEVCIERERLIVAERRKGSVQRVRHHALLFEAVVDHLAEHMRVDHVALPEQSERAIERQSLDRAIIDHQVARDLLMSVASAADRCHDERVARAPCGRGATQILDQRVDLPEHHVVALAHERADRIVDTAPDLEVIPPPARA
jgi:hypothetical protein